MLSSAFLALSFLLLGAEASPLSRRQWNQSIPISANDSSSLPLQLNTKNWDIKKAIDGDFPDPSIWKEGQTWYAFATTSGGINTQVATSSNFKSWNVLQSHDALPTPGAWVDTSAPNIWAPDVFKNVCSRLHNFVLYQPLTQFPEQRTIRPILQWLSSQQPRPPLRRYRHLQHNHRPVQSSVDTCRMSTINRRRNRRGTLSR